MFQLQCVATRTQIFQFVVEIFRKANCGHYNWNILWKCGSYCNIGKLILLAFIASEVHLNCISTLCSRFIIIVPSVFYQRRYTLNSRFNFRCHSIRFEFNPTITTSDKVRWCSLQRAVIDFSLILPSKWIRCDTNSFSIPWRITQFVSLQFTRIDLLLNYTSRWLKCIIDDT